MILESHDVRNRWEHDFCQFVSVYCVNEVGKINAALAPKPVSSGNKMYVKN